MPVTCLYTYARPPLLPLHPLFPLPNSPSPPTTPLHHHRSHGKLEHFDIAETVHGFHSMFVCRDAAGRVHWPVLCAATEPAVYVLRRKAEGPLKATPAPATAP